MPEHRNLREELILAGIEEINIHGANDFSVRRVAEACHVSSAAPYKHFKDKKEFIAIPVTDPKPVTCFLVYRKNSDLIDSPIYQTFIQTARSIMESTTL